MPLVKVPKPKFIEKLQRFFMVDLLKGLQLTLKYNLGAITDKDAVAGKGIYTEQYPKVRPDVAPRFHGAPRLNMDPETHDTLCIACNLCAVACPADAIYLEAAENDGTVQAGPRYASIYQIHKTRCIFCGYCEEACPVSAIFMGKDYELAVYSNKDFIWDKADMLVPAAKETS